MQKIPYQNLAMKRVTPDDAELGRGLPLIAVAQGHAHKIRLPDQPQHFQKMAGNLRHALQQNNVEIWRLDEPSTQAGALFLSHLHKQGQNGLHVDGLVVLPEWRRRGLGSALLEFTAALAQSRGLSFVSWECEDNSPAQSMYRRLGAVARHDVRPFRLTHEKIVALAAQAKAIATDNTSFTVSDGFSLFRAASYGIAGFDMDPMQNSLGLQIEDIAFNSTQDAYDTLALCIKKQYEQRDISFVDMIMPINSEKHMHLAYMLGTAPNSYSGDPTQLWQLHDAALANAARQGSEIHIATEDTAILALAA